MIENDFGTILSPVETSTGLLIWFASVAVKKLCKIYFVSKMEMIEATPLADTNLH